MSKVKTLLLDMEEVYQCCDCGKDFYDEDLMIITFGTYGKNYICNECANIMEEQYENQR